MNQKTLALMLKIIIIGVALCAAAVYIWIIPQELGKPLAEAGNGEFAYCYTPWVIIVSLTALPVAAALVISWMIADNIGKDRSFCIQNAKLLAVISVLAIADTVYFFIANIVMLLLNMSHPGVMLISLFICFVGVAAAVVAAALSHYAYKAAKLQNESDLTI